MNQQTSIDIDEKLEELIQKHQLKQHPEGGWYRQTYKSKDCILPDENIKHRYSGNKRSAGTSIIYLLSRGDFSAWHSVQSDETWFFHQGDPLLLRVINKQTKTLEKIILGGEGGELQFTVSAESVFSAEPLGEFSLVGCMVTPGFEFEDFRLYQEHEFLSLFPKHNQLLQFIRR